MISYRSLVIISLGTLVLMSCSMNYYATSTNVQDLASFQEYGYIYSLPKTRMVVDVIATRNEHIPGPYQQYAKKYLGIDHVSEILPVEWCIEDVKIKSLMEPDPEHFYSIPDRRGKIIKDKVVQFTSHGLMIEINDTKEYATALAESEKGDVIYYTDLSVNRNFPKTGGDDEFSKVSATKKVMNAKTLEKKAEEAANFLIKIRKRRFKLVAGQYESATPDGEALAVSVEELNRLEQEYLSLFIGKIITDTIIRTIVADIPGDKELSHTTIGYFSESKGFLEEANPETESLILEIKDLQSVNQLKNLNMPYSQLSETAIVYYRVPGKGKVKLMLGNKDLVGGEFNIYQLGAIIPYYTF